MGYKVAVVGATGNVGRENDRTFWPSGYSPPTRWLMLASAAQLSGTEVSYGR